MRLESRERASEPSLTEIGSGTGGDEGDDGPGKGHVEDAGVHGDRGRNWNLEAFSKMDNARLFTGKHVVRKGHTATVLGINSGDWGQHMSNIGQRVSENCDPIVTYEQGGMAILQDGAIVGGIGVGGIRGHNADEELAKVGLRGMGL